MIKLMQSALLTNQEILSLQKELPEWQIKESRICRSWVFKNFIEAFGFACHSAT